MTRHKLWIAGVTGAAVSGAACLLPPLLIVLLGPAAMAPAMAFVPPWLDYVLVPAFLFFTGLAVTAWVRRKKPARV